MWRRLLQLLGLRLQRANERSRDETGPRGEPTGIIRLGVIAPRDQLQKRGRDALLDRSEDGVNRKADTRVHSVKGREGDPRFGD